VYVPTAARPGERHARGRSAAARPLFGRWSATPPPAVLVAIEAADIVFAVDSIPTVSGAAGEPFIVFSETAVALLGLQSLTSRSRGCASASTTWTGTSRDPRVRMSSRFSLAVVDRAIATAVAASLLSRHADDGRPGAALRRERWIETESTRARPVRAPICSKKSAHVAAGLLDLGGENEHLTYGSRSSWARGNWRRRHRVRDRSGRSPVPAPGRRPGAGGRTARSRRRSWRPPGAPGREAPEQLLAVDRIPLVAVAAEEQPVASRRRRPARATPRRAMRRMCDSALTGPVVGPPRDGKRRQAAAVTASFAASASSGLRQLTTSSSPSTSTMIVAPSCSWPPTSARAIRVSTSRWM
jgi:hypothetical protein